MTKIIFIPVLGFLLLTTCSGGPNGIVLNPAEMQWFAEESYTITEHKNSAAGEEMPDWVTAYIDGGIAGVENLHLYQERHIFIARNEGSSFSAMNHWLAGFSAELDYPRLAAARIEKRFFSVAPVPDQEYGAYYEELVRIASDYPWTGAVRRDDFWIKKNYFSAEDEALSLESAHSLSGSAHPAGTAEKVTWEFLILLTADKANFQNQLEEIFYSVKPNPLPTKNQLNAINRVKENFFEGF